ncbi:MAG: hypothetical protein FJ037_05230 [Chloroflexi bacterium]|nr:hypothetical protein [Chloroflexota bacterium]
MVQQQHQPTGGKRDPGGDPVPELPDLSWIDKTLGWGIKARVEPFGGGMTVDALNIGVYAEVPDHIPFRNRLPRGAYPAPGAGSIGGYYLQDKHEQWADCAGRLYEEAISRRWSTATDIPWETAHGLNDDVELAICQLATELSQHASVETEVISGWLQNLSPGYHEVKLFLSTATYDSARMFEGYRKRAMVNGGGMMLESPGGMNRAILETYAGWSQTVLGMWFVRNSLDTTILRYLAAYGPTEADRALAARLIPDRMRAAAYATDHIRFAISKKPELAIGFQVWLGGVEYAQARDLRDPVLTEALAIIFGRGVAGMDDGMTVVRRLLQDFVKTYLSRCKQANLDRSKSLSGSFQVMLSGMPAPPRPQA